MTLSTLVLTLVVKSAAFAPGATIPKEHTCDGKDESPLIEISDVPTIAKSWAMVVDDPDAPGGTFVHWVIWNLSPKFRSLGPNVSRLPELVDKSKQGKNDFGKFGWNGPCPPPGKPHHYRFRVWALDGVLALTPGSGAGDLERAIRGHILAEGSLVGVYGR
jgi:Raf kinase inhibitor-like YbhB/YbcL family protein